MKTRRSHSRIVTECYLELKNDENCERAETILRKYGSKTRQEALAMLEEDYYNRWGKHTWEYDGE